MKKYRKFMQDLKENGQAETKISISLWHFIAIAALIFLGLYLFKWK